MLESILQEIKNWFICETYINDFVVQGGGILLPFLQQGQYFRVQGSVFNDGVYKYPAADMHPETFNGAIHAMAIPRQFLELVDRISGWQEKNAAIVESPYQSESFGGYTYTKANDSSTGSAMTWQSVFRNELNHWRKL